MEHEEGCTYRVWIQIECERPDGSFDNGEPDMLHETNSLDDAENYAATLVPQRDLMKLYLVTKLDYDDTEPIAIMSDAERAQKFASSFCYAVDEMVLNDLGPLGKYHKEIEDGKMMFKVSLGGYEDYADMTDEYEPPRALQSVYKTTIWAHSKKEAIEIAHVEWAKHNSDKG